MLRLSKLWTNSEKRTPQLCGVERDGVLLIQIIQNDETLIQLIELKTNKNITIYKTGNIQQGKILGCSINEEKTLLGELSLEISPS